jgi:serine/threonine protein kinase
MATFENIVKGQPTFDCVEPISDEAVDLIAKLLVVDPSARLSANGIDEIQRHPWFADIDWTAIDTLDPPFVPDSKPDDPSTDHLQPRYTFGSHTDDDIVDDIADAVAVRSRAARGMRRTAPSGLLESASDEALLKDFPSVATEQLTHKNRISPRSWDHTEGRSLSRREAAPWL